MKIKWEEVAKTELRKQIAYCLREFGRFTTLRFRERIDKLQTLLSAFPRMGKIEPQLSDKKCEYRSFVVHEHFKMIYRLDEERDIIYIIHFWDTRQEPQNLEQEKE